MRQEKGLEQTTVFAVHHTDGFRRGDLERVRPVFFNL